MASGSASGHERIRFLASTRLVRPATRGPSSAQSVSCPLRRPVSAGPSTRGVRKHASIGGHGERTGDSREAFSAYAELPLTQTGDSTLGACKPRVKAGEGRRGGPRIRIGQVGTPAKREDLRGDGEQFVGESLKATRPLVCADTVHGLIAPISLVFDAQRHRPCLPPPRSREPSSAGRPPRSPSSHAEPPAVPLGWPAGAATPAALAHPGRRGATGRNTAWDRGRGRGRGRNRPPAASRRGRRPRCWAWPRRLGCWDGAWAKRDGGWTAGVLRRATQARGRWSGYVCADSSPTCSSSALGSGPG